MFTNDTWQVAPNAIRPDHFSRKELIPGLKSGAANFTRLDKPSCLDLYVDPLKANADLIIVAANVTFAQNNGSSLIQGWVNGNAATSWDTSTAWICDVYITTGENGYCTRDLTRSFEDQWVLRTWEAPHRQEVAVDYCLIGEQGDMTERCGFHTSIPNMSVVCFFTLLATGLIITTNIKVNDAAFVRLGDAVASFLEEPECEEQTSQQNCVPKKRRTIQARATPWIPIPRIRWYKAVEGKSWLVAIMMYVPAYYLSSRGTNDHCSELLLTCL